MLTLHCISPNRWSTAPLPAPVRGDPLAVDFQRLVGLVFDHLDEFRRVVDVLDQLDLGAAKRFSGSPARSSGAGSSTG